MKVLVTAASRYGATAEIAAAIGRALADHGFEVEVIPPAQVAAIEAYDAVVLGSAVYGGHWLEPAKALVDRSGNELTIRPVWLFSSGPVGNPSRKLVRMMGADPQELPQLRAATGAVEHRMFAGKLERSNLPFLQRAALMLFRGLEGDFRDWTGIETWAAGIAETLRRDAGGRDPGPTP